MHSGSPTAAVEASSRWWHASASSKPPPSARPLMAATTGKGSRSMRSNRSWPMRVASAAAFMSVTGYSCSRSAPTQKVALALVIMTTRAFCSATSFSTMSSALCMLRTKDSPKALALDPARSMTTQAQTPESTYTVT
ncbi:hypothetical protein DQ04_05061060 [Trypanosoma grayi]|uniref:hypothetical protein n=1 Tax=Trypanosoma grayi TaxID=71804 RepID=UPI0004F4BA6B|nr:hypothetical protein DQ04_05061060 [Trypanosoma grayi]KEG09541.1 hypothetical protein DQ04_05061060 [Trypanosoma grayi]